MARAGVDGGGSGGRTGGSRAGQQQTALADSANAVATPSAADFHHVDGGRQHGVGNDFGHVGSLG